ncbi:MAG: AI-2E family transporter [Mariprofundales bacterium]
MYTHPVVLASIILLLGLLLTTAFLKLIHPVLFSLAVALALFTMLTPSINLLRQRGWPSPKAVSTVMAMATLCVIATGAILYPIITDQVQQISRQASQLDQRLVTVLTDTNQWLTSKGMGHLNPQEIASSVLTTVSHKMNHTHEAMQAFFADIATSLLLIPLITFFLLCDFNSLRNQAMQLLPNRHFELGWIIYTRAARQLMNYIGGVSTQAMIMAAICTLGFWIVGVDYAPLLGIIIGLLNTIPFFGIALAKVPPVAVVLMSDEPSGVGIILALAVVFAAQAVDNSYVIPKIVAKSASLHPLTVMLGVMLGGYYFGFFGLILSIPTIFSIKVIHLELIHGLKRQSKHKTT